MKYAFEKHAHEFMNKSCHMIVISGLILSLSACGEVDKNDGNVVNSINLPTGSALKLYCPEAGIAGEPCILDDPDNPYALTPVNDGNKFELNDDTPSAKARFYLWATAQAMNPKGENQYYVARSLHEMYVDSGSELAKEQTLKAYRSVLDNYFNAVTFFGPFTVSGEDVFFPKPVRLLVGENMHSPVAPLTQLFDAPIQALSTFSQWGYTYDDVNTRDFTRNF